MKNHLLVYWYMAIRPMTFNHHSQLSVTITGWEDIKQIRTRTNQLQFVNDSLLLLECEYQLIDTVPFLDGMIVNRFGRVGKVSPNHVVYDRYTVYPFECVNPVYP